MTCNIKSFLVVNLRSKWKCVDQVMIDIDGQHEWRDCLDLPGVRLPQGYYFGATAITGDLSGKQMQGIGGCCTSNTTLSILLLLHKPTTDSHIHITGIACIIYHQLLQNNLSTSFKAVVLF